MVEELKIAEGFQQTDAGIIPNDWVVKPLHEVAHFENGKAHEQFIDEHGDYIVVNSKFISTGGRVKKFSKKNIFPLKKGDITIVMSDIPKGKALAKCFLIDKDDTYTLNQRIGGITANDDTDNKYLFYKLNRNKYYLAFDSGTGQTNIKRQQILDCPIALPPTGEEQRNISKALSDINELIHKSEKFLIKKRNLRNGALQELIKVQTGWKIFELGELIAHTQLGGNYPNTSSESESSLIKMGNLGRGNILLNKLEFIPSHANPSPKDILKYGDVIFNTRNTLELVGKVAIWRDELPVAYFNSNIMRLVFDNNKVESNFYMNYVFNSKGILDQLKNIATGTTSVAAIYTKDLMKIEIPLPPKKEDQTTIATILENMQTEIYQLEKQLTKYKLIEKGLRQDLLTGRKRLI